MFYDWILTFDDGRLVDEGSPYELLNRKSLFKDLVSEHGKDYQKQMMNIAKENYDKK